MKILLMVVAFMFTISLASAQKKPALTEKSQKSTVQSEAFPKSNLTKDFQKENAQFRAYSEPKKNKLNPEKTVLQEIYEIFDQRQRIENNNDLSVSERASQIDDNKNKFNLKNIEFRKYVSSKGIVNISNKEQGYYLSLLKQDGQEEEYRRDVELIKNSK